MSNENEGSAMTDEQIKELIGLAGMVTGDNQLRRDGYYYRSLGVPTNVRETDLIRLVRAALLAAAPRPAQLMSGFTPCFDRGCAGCDECWDDNDPLATPAAQTAASPTNHRREAIEACIAEVLQEMPASRESAPRHWESYEAAWSLRELVVDGAVRRLRAMLSATPSAPVLAAPVAKIEAEDATRLANELEALRQAHWTHWTAAENHTTAVAVRHLRLLADHNAAHGIALPKEG